MAGMTAVEDIRLQNLARLIASHGGQRQLADAIGKSPAQISQWINKSPDAKTGKPRALGSRAARSIEEALSLGEGWMDTVHAPANDGEYQPSQPALLDLGKLSTAQKFLEDLFLGENLRFIPSEHTLLLAAVYDELMTASEPNLVEMAGRYGKRIRGDQDERQGKAGSTLADDRDGTGQGGKPAGAKARRVG